MPEDAPTPAPKVDALAMLGPLAELAAKGGMGAIAMLALVWQVYTGTTTTQARIETLDNSMRTEISGLAVSMRADLGALAARITTLEQRVAVADAIRERDERENTPTPAKR